MRISDWSSDVCSSDLFPARIVHAIDAWLHVIVGIAQIIQFRRMLERCQRGAPLRFVGCGATAEDRQPGIVMIGQKESRMGTGDVLRRIAQTAGHPAEAENGRAAGGERGGRYV